MSIILTTTNTVTIPSILDTDNQPATFTHPTTIDLLSKWATDDIRAASSDINAGIASGDIVVTSNGKVVSDISNLGLSTSNAEDLNVSVNNAGILTWTDALGVDRTFDLTSSVTGIQIVLD